MLKGLKTILLLGGSLHGMLACGSAIAQEVDNSAPQAEASGGLSDIVVTARRREESLISVPVAVSAIGSATLERAGATNLAQIGQLAPQVMMFQGTTGATFSVRGLGSSFLDSGLEQTVAVNIDGVQVSRGRVINAAFFDIAQVEILKGPQALFFGKNSPAGVVSIKSRDPGSELEGYIRAGYEFVADERYIEGAVGGPITDTLGVRVAARGSKMTGYLVNTAAAQPWFWDPTFFNDGAPYRREPRSRDLNGRITMVWKPSSSFSAVLKVGGGKHRDSGNAGPVQLICYAPYQFPVIIGPGVLGPGSPAVPDTSADCKSDNRKASGSFPAEIVAGMPGFEGRMKPWGKQTTWLGSLKLDYELGDVTLTSVTGYYYINHRSAFMSEYSSLDIISALVQEHNKTFTQEVRAVSDFDSSLNFTVGGYFETVNSSTTVDALLIYTGPDPRDGIFTSGAGGADNSNRTYSLFGQARWNILENLELAGGVRWTREKKRSDVGNSFVNQNIIGAFPYLPEGVIRHARFSGSNFSPEATLTWHPDRDMTVYAAYKTGYKSGGVSSPTLITANFTDQNLVFDPEKAKGFEVGAKGFLFGRTLRAELSAYRYDYNDLQVSAFDAPTLSFLIQNAASARVQGVEGSVEWKALPALTLQAAVAYNHARYRKYTNASCGALTSGTCALTSPLRVQNLSGEPLPNAPDWSGNVGAVFDTPLTTGIRLGLNADVNFSSSYFTQDNNDPLPKQGAFARINAGARIHADDDRWEVALIGRNLNNKYVKAWTTDVPFGPHGNYASQIFRPREVTLQGTFRF